MRLRLSKSMAVCIGIICLLAAVAIFADHIAPHDPEKASLDETFQLPSEKYPFGTDHMGRCILSRVIYGSRISLAVGAIVVSLSFVIGTGLGIVSGYYGGALDETLMRIVDTFMAFPGILLALAIAGIFGGGVTNLVIALTAVEWTGYARIARGSALAMKEQDFVKASRGLGEGNAYLMARHVLPNIISPVLVIATMSMAGTILSMSGLSFLGVGIQPPTPEWGYMINDGKMFIRSAPYIIVFPGLAIMITVIAFNTLGDGLRDMLDPKSKVEIV
jgi:peptide/nickel transport system permease protein